MALVSLNNFVFVSYCELKEWIASARLVASSDHCFASSVVVVPLVDSIRSALCALAPSRGRLVVGGLCDGFGHRLAGVAQFLGRLPLAEPLD